MQQSEACCTAAVLHGVSGPGRGTVCPAESVVALATGCCAWERAALHGQPSRFLTPGHSLQSESVVFSPCMARTACWACNVPMAWLQPPTAGTGILLPRFITHIINPWSSQWLNGTHHSAT